MMCYTTIPTLFVYFLTHPRRSPPVSPTHRPTLRSPTPPMNYSRLAAGSNHSLCTTASALDCPQRFTATPGVTAPSSGAEPVDFFLHVFDDSVCELIHTQTVRYYQQYLVKNQEHLDQHKEARAHIMFVKHPITIDDIYRFISILIAMGICGYPTISYVYM